MYDQLISDFLYIAVAVFYAPEIKYMLAVIAVLPWIYLCFRDVSRKMTCAFRSVKCLATWCKHEHT